MGLVQNLKKILSESGKIILQGLLSHYIKQRAKQTLKRQDNSSETMSSSNLLTTEPLPTTIATSSADTTEKTIMAEPTTEEIVRHIHDWATDRITSLVQPPDPDYIAVFEPDSESVKDAMALASEFGEWFGDDDNSPEIEIMSIEKY
jgi:hypothetical protein